MGNYDWTGNVKGFASQSLNDLDFSKSPYDLEISVQLRG
jgi:hypothetical protein